MFKRQHDRLTSALERVFGPVAGSVALFLIEVIEILVVSALIIWPVRTYVITPFVVRGASMEPNFYDREYLVIDDLSYQFRQPERGEIIVFKYPRDPSQYFIKRTIGLPGETVEVSDGQVTVYNAEHPLGFVLDETYIGTEKTLGKKRTELGEDEYFVLGDNRGYSLDSRSFGPVTGEMIVGRVWVRGFPFNRISTFDLPTYSL